MKFAVLVFGALASATYACNAEGERCAGAPGFPAVPWVGCCDSDASCVEDPARGWGKWCVKASGSSGNGNCYNEGERCQGAPGFPFVEYKECCDSSLECKDDASRGWGKWCVGNSGSSGSGGNANCYNEGERCQGAPGFPFVEYKECCDSSLECKDDASRGWGKWCVGNSGSSGSGGNANCYNEGERCQGAPGFPFVEYKECCDSSLECKDDASRGWGKWCVSSGSGNSGGDVPVGWSIPETNGSPNARHEATFLMGDNGKAYLLGGRRIQPVNVYDVATNSWSSVSSPPIELHHFQAVFYNGYVWIPSSWTGGFPFEQVVSEFYAYNVGSDTWETRTAMPEDRRRGSGATVVHDGKIYVAMGNVGGHGEHADVKNWFDVYDIATDSWSTLPDAPAPRDHTGGGMVGGRLCVAGGRDTGVADFFDATVASTVCYNFGTGAWDFGPDIPEPRAGSSYGVTCDGKLVVAGGEGSGQAYSRVDVFNGESWEDPTYMVQARHGSGVAVGNCACGNLFVASGSGNQGGTPELTSLEMYSPSGSKC